MVKHTFNTKHVDISKKYTFITKQLEGVEFYIELSEGAYRDRTLGRFHGDIWGFMRRRV